MNKKFFAVLVSLFLAGFLAAAEDESIDLVLMMDTSSSMHSSYKELSEYVVGPLLREFLRLDDTFHLISFSGSPHAELSRRIEGSGDVETIIGRMLLMYPLDPYSDVLAALEYAGRYLTDLPDTRSKTLILISDGEHAPPPSSPYAGKNTVELESKLSETTSRLKGNGWTFYFLRVPHSGSIPKLQTTRKAQSASRLTGASSGTNIGSTKASSTATGATGAMTSTSSTATGKAIDGGANDGGALDGGALDVSDTVSELLAAPLVDWETGKEGTELSATLGSIMVVFPSDIGKTGRSLRIPLSVKNPSLNKVYLETNSILINGKESMEKRSFKELKARSEGQLDLLVRLPDDMLLGQTSVKVEPKFSGSVRISPQSGEVSFILQDKAFSTFMASILPFILIFFGLGLAILLALFIIMLLRRLTKSPSGTLAASYNEIKDEKHKDVASIRQPSAKDDAELLSSYAQAETGRKSLLLESKDSQSRNANQVEGSSVGTASTRTTAIVGVGTAEKGIVEAGAVGMGGIVAAGSERKRGSLNVTPPPYLVRKAEARIMLSLFVEDQNTAIGRRNVHLLKAGSTLSLGGGRSDFLVFLVPLPQHIADIRFDGGQCIFVPRRTEFFPDLAGEVLLDCVGKNIRILSSKEYELKIRFDKFQDPLEQLNKFLHSIEIPGRN